MRDKICGWMSVGFSTAAVHSGSGRHIQTLSETQISGAIRFTLFGFVPGILSYVFPKMAVVNLLSRLLNPSRFHLRWLWFMAISCLITMMGSVAIAFSQCQPTRSQWDFSVVPDFCWSKWILVKYSWGSCGQYYNCTFENYNLVVLLTPSGQRFRPLWTSIFRSILRWYSIRSSSQRGRKLH